MIRSGHKTPYYKMLQTFKYLREKHGDVIDLFQENSEVTVYLNHTEWQDNYSTVLRVSL